MKQFFFYAINCLCIFSQTPVCLKPGIHSIQQCSTYGASIAKRRHWLQMYSMSEAYILNILNLLSVNSTADGSKEENKVNMILNALFIRNVRPQIWRRVASVNGLCLQLSTDTRVVISDARETLTEARDEAGEALPGSGNRCAAHSQQLYPSHSGLVGDSGLATDWRWYLT